MMRRVHYADVAAAARAIMRAEPDVQSSLCHRMIREARCADAFRRETGRAHPLWGSGSLMEVARQRPLAPERGFEDPVFCAAMRLVLDCLLQTVVTRTRS